MKRFLFILSTASFLFGSSERAWSQMGGGCYHCIPGPNGGYGCLPNQMIGWASCVPDPTICDHGPECNTGSGCFLGGTRIATPGGDVPIESLEVGDEVLSKSSNGEPLYARVTKTYRTIEVGYFVINGGISVTATHPIRVGERWVVVEDLRIGDEIVGPDGATIVVESMDEIHYGVRVYNIEVDGTHTFFADGLLVHNKGPDPQG